ncbi:Toxin Doc [Planctomycetes bacterium MalM25]|nr:Toxin Doc [Planctomycetes bacterium MalM25]
MATPEPIWIDRSVVLAAHELQLEEHGGQQGLRDEGLLESALGRPRNLWAYGDPKPDSPALAAAYAFGLAKNHPFLDGNKRIAAVVCEAFLNTQGVMLLASDDEWYKAVLALAAGETPEQDFAAWLRDHARPIG